MQANASLKWDVVRQAPKEVKEVKAELQLWKVEEKVAEKVADIVAADIKYIYKQLKEL